MQCLKINDNLIGAPGVTLYTVQTKEDTNQRNQVKLR